MKRFLIVLIVCSLIQMPQICADVEDPLLPTDTSGRVREHPKTGKPFVSITDNNNPEGRYPFSSNIEIYSRPDYKMLDHKIKAGEVPYDGPSSSRTKVYVFAATIATAGAATGAFMPVAASTGATGSAAGPLLGAATVAGAGAGAYHYGSKINPDDDDFIERAEARWLETNGETIHAADR